MILRPVPFLSTEDREKLKPQKDDVVVFEGKRYIVLGVGLKYVQMSPEDNPKAVSVAKITQVAKVFPETTEEDNGFHFPPQE